MWVAGERIPSFPPPVRGAGRKGRNQGGEARRARDRGPSKTRRRTGSVLSCWLRNHSRKAEEPHAHHHPIPPSARRHLAARLFRDVQGGMPRPEGPAPLAQAALRRLRAACSGLRSAERKTFLESHEVLALYSLPYTPSYNGGCERGNGPLHLVVDSSGLAIVGEGEWAAVKHGGSGKRGWRKLHLGVDGAGVIVVQCLTRTCTDDAATAIDLIAALDGDLVTFTADGAYDRSAVYDAGGARGARVVIPPSTTATSSRRPRSARALATVRSRGCKRSAGDIGRRRPDTTIRPVLRTPSSDTSRSWVTAFARDANEGGKLRTDLRAASSIG